MHIAKILCQQRQTREKVVKTKKAGGGRRGGKEEEEKKETEEEEKEGMREERKRTRLHLYKRPCPLVRWSVGIGDGEEGGTRRKNEKVVKENKK